jgi:tRNA (cytidine56-2'-O)-methyltransferase
VEDKSIKGNVEKVVAEWGGPFTFEMGIPWKKAVTEWRANNGVVVHLTMYGQDIVKTQLISQLRASQCDIMVVVGSQKVPGEFFSEEFSDYNIAIGGQPHSEVAALAVFLDRLFEGSELSKDFKQARFKVLPSQRGKHLVEVGHSSSGS